MSKIHAKKNQAALTAKKKNSDGSKDDQIIALLNVLGDKMMRSEQERAQSNHLLKKTAQQVEDLENWSDQSERAFLTIHDRISKRESASQNLEERIEIFMIEQEPLKKKIEKAAGLSDQIAKAIEQQEKITQRLEQFTQDRSRIARKLERIEEGLFETREAINANSALFPANGAHKNTLPPKAVKSSVPFKKEQKSPNSNNETPWWKPGVPSQAVAVIVVMIIALGAGWHANEFKQSGFLNYIQNSLAKTTIAVTDETDHPFDPLDTYQEDIAHNNNAPILDEETSDQALAGIINPAAAGKANTITADQLAAITPAAGNAARDIGEEAANQQRQPQQDASPHKNTEQTSAKATPDAKAPQSTSLSGTDYRPDFNIEAFLKSQKPSAPLNERIQKDPNLPPMIKDVETQAFNGLSSAQHDLGVVYSAGHAGVGIDYKKSFVWFKEAAFDDVPNARYNLGVLYHQGLGVTQDTALAINWYRAAAELNHPDALYNLGIANIEGIGMAYAPQEAVYYFEKAAEQGIMEASYNLGLIYENGLLGQSDLDQAIYWYKIATDQKSIEGKNALEELTTRLGYNEEDINRLLNEFGREITTTQTDKISESQKNQSKTANKTIPVKTGGLTKNDKVTPTHNESGFVSFESAKAQDKSIIIAQIQEQLIDMGYYPGPANGISDQRTEDAIISYQSRFDLPLNGHSSEALLIHMMSNDLVELGQGSRP